MGHSISFQQTFGRHVPEIYETWYTYVKCIACHHKTCIACSTCSIDLLMLHVELSGKIVKGIPGIMCKQLALADFTESHLLSKDTHY